MSSEGQSHNLIQWRDGIRIFFLGHCSDSFAYYAWDYFSSEKTECHWGQEALRIYISNSPCSPCRPIGPATILFHGSEESDFAGQMESNFAGYLETLGCVVRCICIRLIVDLTAYHISLKLQQQQEYITVHRFQKTLQSTKNTLNEWIFESVIRNDVLLGSRSTVFLLFLRLETTRCIFRLVVLFVATVSCYITQSGNVSLSSSNQMLRPQAGQKEIRN